MPEKGSMRSVQLNEADDQLAGLVGEVEAGESITILRNNRPVAQIIPFLLREPAAKDDRLAAVEELREIMSKGYNLGIVWNGREELYERGPDTE